MGGDRLSDMLASVAPGVALRALLDGVPAGIAVLADDGAALVVNATLAALLEMPSEQLIGVPVTSLMRQADGQALPFFELAAGAAASWRHECTVTTARGREHRLDVSIARAQTDGRAVAYVLTAIDLTARQDAVAQLTETALVDELTGLYNRRGFLTFARRQADTASRLHAPIGLLFMDLDGLKNVNDRLGHAEGDRMIREAADVIRSTLRGADIIGRIGGDEFVACVVETSENGLATLISRLRAALEASATEPRPYHLRMSCGVARSSADTAHDVEHLLAEADARMYVAKRARAGAREDVLNVVYGTEQTGD